MGNIKFFKILQFHFVLCSLLFLAVSASAEDNATLERLEKIIQQQQVQIQEQAEAIKGLQEKVSKMQTGSVKAAEPGKDKKSIELVNSGNEKAKVTLYGQVNRGVLFVDDGDDTNLYQVDNDHSSTRIGIVGSTKASDALEVGTKIEVQFESNSSSEVNQFNKRGVGNNYFTKRHLDLYLNTLQYGKFSLGFGSTASDTTSETDFSGTTLVGYSGVTDMAGGQLFYDNMTKAYTTTTVGSVYSNMDGLSRDDRIRYDTPSFYGFSGATSYIADGGGDIALRYGTKIDGMKLAVAASYANPGSTSDKTDYQLSSSLSVLHDSGISLTLSGGQREFKNHADGDGLFLYTKLGYQADLLPIGKTAFSVDCGVFEDIAMNNDEATTFGAQFVQNLKNWGTEYYLGYRLYKLDRDNADYDDINAILSGFRIKF